MSTVIVAFGVVFLAEFGDKTEIVTLALVTRYGARSVLLGITLATCLISAASVALGGLLRTTIPTRPATIVAGLAFLGFAVWTMRLDDGEVIEPAHRARSTGGAVAVIGGTFLLTEIGDKTSRSPFTERSLDRGLRSDRRALARNPCSIPSNRGRRPAAPAKTEATWKSCSRSCWCRRCSCSWSSP